MTKHLSWRLSKLPTPSELTELVKEKIITQEEAKDILLKNEETTDRDIESFQSEIKFLREMVEKLSKNPSTIIETIKYVEKPYVNWGWYHPYQTWCGLGNATALSVSGSASAADIGGAMYLTATAESGSSFSDVNTF